jgi:hypothetical protein
MSKYQWTPGGGKMIETHGMELLKEREAMKRLGGLARTKLALQNLVNSGVGGIRLRAISSTGGLYFRAADIDQFIQQLGDAVKQHITDTLAFQQRGRGPKH